METNNNLKIFTVSALIILITIFHYLSIQTGNLTVHLFLRRLYYIPIILSGIWFGLNGGLLSSASAAILFLPHQIKWINLLHQDKFDGYMEIALFLLIGTVTGLITSIKEKRAADLKRAYIDTVSALSEAIDSKDSYTEGHCKRVKSLTVLIASKMNVNKADIEVLQDAALLHDVGKIGISENILNKSSKLLPEEYLHIKNHSVAGAKIVSRVQNLKKCAEIILHHHERYNGSGYPSHLRGERIPLGSRILSAADTFDSMVTDRPYRKTMMFSEAVREIEKYRSIYYDPAVVDTLKELYDTNEIFTIYKKPILESGFTSDIENFILINNTTSIKKDEVFITKKEIIAALMKSALYFSIPLKERLTLLKQVYKRHKTKKFSGILGND